ncbi:MAG: DUF3784 domain-containing protein [Lachnospiraceae bacterium]|nr:DUF3784 domain-containing protein [Lachnospiraceae bacterium]
MFFNNVLAEVIGISVLYFFDSYTLRESDDLFNCYYGRQRLFPTHTCARSLKKYDEKKMCKDYGKRMMLWPIPFFIGAVIDFIFPIKGILIAWVIWSGMFILLLIERHKREI